MHNRKQTRTLPYVDSACLAAAPLFHASPADGNCAGRFEEQAGPFNPPVASHPRVMRRLIEDIRAQIRRNT